MDGWIVASGDGPSRVCRVCRVCVLCLLCRECCVCVVPDWLDMGHANVVVSWCGVVRDGPVPVGGVLSINRRLAGLRCV